MKKLMYLLVVGVLFTFTACVEETESCANDCGKECCVPDECADYCAKACCLGCNATEGEAPCDLLKAGDLSCCVQVTSLRFGKEYEEYLDSLGTPFEPTYSCIHGHDHDYKSYLDSLKESGDVDIEYSEDHNHDH